MHAAVKHLHDADRCGYLWTKQRAEALAGMHEARVNTTLDLANLAEEVESLGRAGLRATKSQLRRLPGHLLKLDCGGTAEQRPGWRRSVSDARLKLADLMTATPERDLPAELGRLYSQARRQVPKALADHGESEAAASLPVEIPYRADQLFSDHWFPADRHGLDDGR